MYSFLFLLFIAVYSVSAESTINWNAAIEYAQRNPLEIRGIENCGRDNDVFELQDVIINPDPPKVGSSLNITVVGNLKSVIDQGSYVKVRVRYGLITVVNTKIDLCKEISDYPELPQCPVQPGRIAISEVTDMPDAPKGFYRADISGFTASNAQIFCVVYKFKL
ncbi:hypothetical protein O9G_000719 [Rozella allomycis CSF55]|uniref:Phosphatidylglycerol/phosphatidylinositol transfer protein n=2 Tax=Rozella allomycis (strain CSF55) TaxID=988480 RepID=A0A075B3D4_ROZAC|nr:hypothetical protein O9G_000719 [Rozella allomycis CSF55]|eukprot:EPZ35323.1 hypothetical protein O9G_000719 [Rozella allomycis CSF55]